jgi:ATP-binding cassette subfamily B (MDR/TAP) protein 1
MGSIFQNVSYGLVGTEWEHTSEADQVKLVEEACKAAYAHDFVKTLPEVRLVQSRSSLI